MTQDTFDTTRKFVRVIGTLPNGLIEFEFAIGDPEVSAELVMPKAAFDEFCRVNQVIRIGDAQAVELDRDRAKWQHGEPAE